MANEFTIKQGDLRRPLRLRLLDEDGEAVDVNADEVSSLKFIMTKYGESTPTIADGTITTVQEGTGGSATDKGVVEYAWQSSDTSEVGRYSAEVEVTYSSGATPQTFPGNGYITVVIQSDLG